ncbi:hypothetical protein ACFWBN_22630 [Streptomyces sp. NPDC059989]|uniref:hypothetical protein n=1 Tax=Streptomyces sp. NPDC059989 TaxID=3347026 RepID=UPI0036C38AB8
MIAAIITAVVALVVAMASAAVSLWVARKGRLAAADSDRRKVQDPAHQRFLAVAIAVEALVITNPPPIPVVKDLEVLDPAAPQMKAEAYKEVRQALFDAYNELRAAASAVAAVGPATIVVLAEKMVNQAVRVMLGAGLFKAQAINAVAAKESQMVDFLMSHEKLILLRRDFERAISEHLTPPRRRFRRGPRRVAQLPTPPPAASSR